MDLLLLSLDGACLRVHYFKTIDGAEIKGLPLPVLIEVFLDLFSLRRKMMQQMSMVLQYLFEIMYEAYRARVFGFLVRLSRSRTVAEDLLDETWLRLVSKARWREAEV
jgi:hypothetical protein